MRVHHLNCGTLCPFGGRFMDGRPGVLRGAAVVCHCLLIETDAGLVLVDTGLGLGDVGVPGERLAAFFRGLVRPQLRREETAFERVRALGFVADDVRHIVLTHLDFDHAGGIEDFPRATVHVLAAELAAARMRRGLIARGRYRPHQWNEDVKWAQYRAEGERWSGFECVRGLRGLPEDILLVPLVGHTWGHCGVAVRADDRWLLHAGDAYFHREEMADPPRCTPGLAAYQRMMEVERRRRLENQARLRSLARRRRGEVEVFCSHDPFELARMATRAAAPAGEARPI